VGTGGALVDIGNGTRDAIARVTLITHTSETAVRVNALGIIMTVIGALVTLVNIGNDRCLIIIVVSVVITTLVVSAASLIILVLIFVSVLLPIGDLLIVWSVLLLFVRLIVWLELLFVRLVWLELLIGSICRSIRWSTLLIGPLLTLLWSRRLDRWPLVLWSTLIVLLWAVVVVELLLIWLVDRASLLLLIGPLLTLLLVWRPLLLLLLLGCRFLGGSFVFIATPRWFPARWFAT